MLEQRGQGEGICMFLLSGEVGLVRPAAAAKAALAEVHEGRFCPLVGGGWDKRLRTRFARTI